MCRHAVQYHRGHKCSFYIHTWERQREREREEDRNYIVRGVGSEVGGVGDGGPGIGGVGGADFEVRKLLRGTAS